MRFIPPLTLLLALSPLLAAPAEPLPEEIMLRRIYTEALSHAQAYENLRALTTLHPGRFSGSPALADAVQWGRRTLESLGLDRVYLQEVMVPRWERGSPESVRLLPPARVNGEAVALSALALGGTVATPSQGLVAKVIAVNSLDELDALGRARLTGKIVFFNRPLDPTLINTQEAYGGAVDQRSRGPITAARLGAVGALVRSMTLARDDVPHTGNTTYAPEGPNIPAAALSTLAADRLSAALQADPHLRVEMKIHARWLPDAPSHNVIGEIRGTEFPDEILLVGGHLDSWDITPGAHDDGAGVVQSIEVLRLFRALGLKPRHTIRCVLFTNEENGARGATAYAAAARAAGEKHLFAIESDSGGFSPRGFALGSTQGPVHERARRWQPLFAPYGVTDFVSGPGGVDVAPLLLFGATVGHLVPDSQRYFDHHHAANDTIDKVNPRELHLGAAALASLLWLVDQQGL